MKYTKLILDERMIVPKPKIRLEFFLHAIVTGETCELKPKTVDEEYLYAIATSDTSRMGEIYPRTLVEIYYDAILNNSVEDLPTPRTRWEEFLRSAVTKEPCELEPETSLEIYLSQISSNGGFDYIVSTSTNSTIISLPNSTSGIIKSIEMDGNTLVNYCQDGVKELTLNNEINAEGTNVTLTECVDDGKVDVVCEGNTLVNLFSGIKTVGTNLINFKLSYTPKKNTLYTVIFNISYQTSNGELPWGGFLNKDSSDWRGQFSKDNMKQGLNIAKVITQDNDDLGDVFRIGWNPNVVSNVEINNLIILEGDYTNKSTPSYFEGMKSAFELEDNKVEIVSRKNLNLFNRFGVFEGYNTNVTYNILDSNNNILVSNGSNPHFGLKEGVIGQRILLEQNTDYILEARVDKGDVYATINDYNTGKIITKVQSDNYGKLEFNSNNVTEIFLVPYRGNISSSYYTYINLYKSDLSNDIYETGVIKSPYIDEFKTSKKEIQLSEPLRGLPSGVCDKFVKQGGKWYVERNCGITIADGNKKYILDNVNLDTRKNISAYFTIESQFVNGYKEISKKLLTSSFTECEYDRLTGSIGDLIGIGTVCRSEDKTQRILISMPKTNLTTLDINGFKQWLQNNPLTIIHQLATPTYEEITDPQLTTYLDTTHISTNSTIPCNIQVKNSGYNAIIKPSTQYTVAFDANKSGEVGINLGGAKVTTTNNVATITTPSELTDDNLRLYGKGIKASNVRLLEGDKTNYIPQYFEGMKSCFEDKEQDNGSYKMEILSYINNYIKTLGEGHNIKTIYSYSTNSIQPYLKYFNLVDNYNKCNNLFDYYYVSNNNTIWINLGTFNRTNALYILNQKISECEGKSNKIQLSSIEPLRAVGDVKDRFVLKDGKLMIERNVGYDYIDGLSDKYSFNAANHQNTDKWHGFDLALGRGHHKMGTSNVRSDNLSFGICEYGVYTYRDYCFVIRIPKYDNIVKLNDVNSFREWFKANPTKFIYELAEPTYEEVPTSQKLTCYENATLFIDTNITPTHVEIEYPTEKQQLFKKK